MTDVLDRVGKNIPNALQLFGERLPFVIQAERYREWGELIDKTDGKKLSETAQAQLDTNDQSAFPGQLARAMLINAKLTVLLNLSAMVGSAHLLQILKRGINI